VIAGLVFSTLLVYLSLRELIFRVLPRVFEPSIMDISSFPDLDVSYAGSEVLPLGTHLSPLEKVDQLSLFSVTSVGFLAIVAIPARLGELARPISSRKKAVLK